MRHKKLIFMLVTAGLVLVAGTGIWLASAQPASAQCGSSASSCKNCHEVQSVMPVNQDGTPWHQSHAFGDFCYICHAGNSQSLVESEAHTGLVAPLADVEASCQQCHVSDLDERAAVYASILGVEIGSGSAPVTTDPGTTAPESGEPPVAAPADTTLDVDDPNIIDYAGRYDEIVLGKRPLNWGNVILIAMIAMLALGGGGFVLVHEKMVKVSFGDTRRVENEYPADLVEMLPALSGLKPQARRSLLGILRNPGKTEKVLGLIDEIVSDTKSEE
jgi:hypothetical protein